MLVAACLCGVYGCGAASGVPNAASLQRWACLVARVLSVVWFRLTQDLNTSLVGRRTRQ